MNHGDAYYRSHETHPPRPAALALNVFGEYVDPDEREYQPPPCRSIPVTDELRRRDQQMQHARERAQSPDWKIKAELSQANLQRAREDRKQEAQRERIGKRKRARPAPPIMPTDEEMDRFGRGAAQVEVAMHTLPRPVPLEAMAIEPAVIEKEADEPSEVASETEPAAETNETASEASAPRVCSTGCGRALRLNNRTGICSHCQHTGNVVRKRRRAEELVDAAHCLDCGSLLRSDNSTGLYCWRCKAKRRAYYKPQHPELPLATCSQAGCARKLRRSTLRRADGMCAYHGGLKDRRSNETIRKGRMRGACRQCGVPIGTHTLTGLCPAHSRKHMQIRTVLRAASPEEHELNQVWASLSLADKVAVLADALEAA